MRVVWRGTLMGLALASGLPPTALAQDPAPSASPIRASQPSAGPDSRTRPRTILSQEAAALRRSLADELAALGPRSSVWARDADSGELLLSLRARRRLIPASAQKLWTAAAVTLAAKPDARISTRVAAAQRPDARGRVGDLWLIGDGDPSLTRAHLRGLARRLRAQGLRQVTGRVRADESHADRLRGGPSTDGAPDVWLGGLLGGLTVDHGSSGRRGPGVYAANAFATQLRRAKIKVRGGARTGVAPRRLRTLAVHRSATLNQLLGPVLRESDNFYAETLLKRLGSGSSRLALERLGSSLGPLGAELGVGAARPVWADGSGLSRFNRSSAAQLGRLLELMRAHPRGSAFMARLPRVGAQGTVAGRGAGTRGRCRAKTGTLRDVSSLAGVCVAAGHTPIVFALISNSVNPWQVKPVEDRIMAALVAYRPWRVRLEASMRHGCLTLRSRLWKQERTAPWLRCVSQEASVLWDQLRSGPARG